MPSRFNLAEQARALLVRSGWQDVQQRRLSRECRALLARLDAVCAGLVATSPLKPGEVAGEIALGAKEFRTIFLEAAGARQNPQTVWSDGSNELLVDIARIAIKTMAGLVLVTIPVSCEETGQKSILVSFATGSEKSPAGLIFAAETIPEGPPEIVEIWGEALVALAWTALLRAVSATADAAGTDLDGAGLVPAGMEADEAGVKLLVMARHEMDRVPR